MINMKEKKIVFERNYSFSNENRINSAFIIIKAFNDNKKIVLTTFFLLVCFLYIYQGKNNNNFTKYKEKIYFDQYEVNKYDEIKEKLNLSQCSLMWANQKEFLNGIIRKFKPRKFLEIGVYRGGSSIIILNAINDIKGSSLYSIDLNTEEKVGECVNKFFPELSKNYKLYKGKIATEFIEKIGNNIDMALIDTAHYEPGEILDFLMILPFLKENAIVIFHDIGNQITRSSNRREWAPYIIFNGIRGEKYYPSGNFILKHDIGAVRLDNNQKKYYHDYFRLLSGQWQYFPKEIHIKQMRNFIKKYYDDDCLIMFEEATNFNRRFVRNNPAPLIFNFTSD